MDPLCIFVITSQDFFSVLLIFFSCMNYFLLRLFTFFMLLYVIKFFTRTTKEFICLQIKMFMSPSHAIIYVSLLRGALIPSHAFTFNR